MPVELPDHLRQRMEVYQKHKTIDWAEPPHWIFTLDKFKPDKDTLNDRYVYLQGGLALACFGYGLIRTQRGFRMRDQVPLGQLHINSAYNRIMGFCMVVFGGYNFARMVSHAAYFHELKLRSSQPSHHH